MEQPLIDACSQMTQRHFKKIIQDAIKNKSSARELLKSPRAFFRRHRVVVPRKAEFVVLPNGSMQRMMLTSGGRRRLAHLCRQKKAKEDIRTGHIEKGVARCTTIVIR